MSYTVAALYRFVRIDDAPALREKLKQEFTQLGLFGTLLVAPEGINGTLAGSPAAIEAMLNLLASECGLARDEVKFSEAPEKLFDRLKVKLKREIITMRTPEADPTQRVGQYVEAKDWNALIADPEVLVLDTRNDYEVAYGTFDRALDPNIQHFTDFVPFVREQLKNAKHKKVAMFCTGGIRCEKASAFMLAEGFDEVYHLKGGILKYLEEVPAEQSRWQGTCFVFDQRVALEHGLTPSELGKQADKADQ